MVMQNNVIKYITKIGQNTGTLKQSKKVQISAITVLLLIEYQNLNSGNRLTNGLNSSFALVGSSGPFSSAEKNNKHQFRTTENMFQTHHQNPWPDQF